MTFTPKKYLGILLVAGASVFACGLGSSVPAIAAADPATTTTAATAQRVAPPEFYVEFGSALQITNQYWATHFSEFVAGGVYSPPQLINVRPDLGAGFYEAIGTTNDTVLSPAGDLVPCGNIFLYDNNAFYCGPPFTNDADYVAFDHSFMAHNYALADSFVYFVVAHEWAHSIQARVAAPARAVEAELQADCIAGGTLQGMSNDGTLIIEPGDNEELATVLTNQADAYQWTKTGDHGSAAQRIAAYNKGVTSGVNSCWVPAA